MLFATVVRLHSQQFSIPYDRLDWKSISGGCTALPEGMLGLAAFMNINIRMDNGAAADRETIHVIDGDRCDSKTGTVMSIPSQWQQYACSEIGVWFGHLDRDVRINMGRVNLLEATGPGSALCCLIDYSPWASDFRPCEYINDQNDGVLTSTVGLTVHECGVELRAYARYDRYSAVPSNAHQYGTCCLDPRCSCSDPFGSLVLCVELLFGVPRSSLRVLAMLAQLSSVGWLLGTQSVVIGHSWELLP